MRRLHKVLICVLAAGLGFTSPAPAADKYDGSAPMLYAVTAMSECEASVSASAARLRRETSSRLFCAST